MQSLAASVIQVASALLNEQIFFKGLVQIYCEYYNNSINIKSLCVCQYKIVTDFVVLVRTDLSDYSLVLLLLLSTRERETAKLTKDSLRHTSG